MDLVIEVGPVDVVDDAMFTAFNAGTGVPAAVGADPDDAGMVVDDRG
jgi:hypothetical protein